MGLSSASHTHSYTTVLNDVEIIIITNEIYMKSIWTVADGGHAHFMRLAYTVFYV